MSVFRAAVLSGAVLFATTLGAPAMTVADLGKASGLAAPASFMFSDQIAPGRPGGLDAQAMGAAAQNYFDYDTLITLGALALAGGAMAALGASAARREAAATSESAWRQTVMRAVQADLAEFTANFRRAA
jgi:hypothetical protein